MRKIFCAMLLASGCWLILACGPSRTPKQDHSMHLHPDSDTSARVRPIELPPPASADSLLNNPNSR